ncbi:HD domain-containing protein [Streptomyces lycii]|uniref:HD domain-containing protein n=1 Tax=Streptomyces lycii TaxID=2654337 RepID=A0ABQ7FCK4_9ACTN|nr:HD domain-containing protein [Streptomyces lycii]
MRVVPPGACAYILCAVLAAGLCAAPAVRPDAGTPWAAVALLAFLYAVCEQLTRCPLMGHRAPADMGSFVPVLLAGTFLLSPSAAALVAVPGALAGRVGRRPAWPRRVWHAAQLALSAFAAGHVFRALAPGGGGRPVEAADFPYALLPAVAGALAFCCVLGLLECGVLVTAERMPAGTACAGLPRTVAPYLAHGLAGLLMSVLWLSPYGPVAALLVLLPMYISCWMYAQYHRERTAHRSTIRALVQAVDIKDRYTRGHGERVGRASALIAGELGMADDRLEAVRFAGLLHDIGKLGVPTRLLRKDGPLTPEERRVIELHPEYGHEIVRGIAFLEEARAAILHHHERLDGSGYPYGLSGHRIPEFARVVAVADAFDAMTSNRSYRRARPVEAAVTELRRCAGTQFDPRMVRALARAIDRHGWHPAVTADMPPRPPAAPDPGREAPEEPGREATAGPGRDPGPQPSSSGPHPSSRKSGAHPSSRHPGPQPSSRGSGPQSGWKPGPPAVPDRSPDLSPDLSPDFSPDLSPDLSPDFSPDRSPDLSPDLSPGLSADRSPDRSPDSGRPSAPDCGPPSAQESAPDSAPSPAPPSVPESVPDPVPESVPEAGPATPGRHSGPEPARGAVIPRGRGRRPAGASSEDGHR